MTCALSDRKCAPCEGGVSPLEAEEIATLKEALDSGWHIVENHHLEKSYGFDDFQGALSFTNKIGALAEDQGHHPEIHLGWGKVRVEIWTHAVSGLTENDFILAAKIDDIGRRG